MAHYSEFLPPKKRKSLVKLNLNSTKVFCFVHFDVLCPSFKWRRHLEITLNVGLFILMPVSSLVCCRVFFQQSRLINMKFIPKRHKIPANISMLFSVIIQKQQKNRSYFFQVDKFHKCLYIFIKMSYFSFAGL